MLPPLLQIGDVLITTDILIEPFCCDIDACRGICCVEGDAGAPVTKEEVAAIEDTLPKVWNRLSASAQAVIDKQGVAYIDEEGDLVTSIVNGKDCVFTCYKDGCCLCSIEDMPKPVSCALYPIREVHLKNGLIGLNYHRWNVCRTAVDKGRKINMPMYVFLKQPLIRRFGKEWYDELCIAARQLKENKR